MDFISSILTTVEEEKKGKGRAKRGSRYTGTDVLAFCQVLQSRTGRAVFPRRDGNCPLSPMSSLYWGQDGNSHL